MPVPHVLLVLAVVFVWGTNFVVTRWALDEVPPLTTAALRFFFAAWPGVWLMPRPRVAWRWLAASGLAAGPGQFGLLYWAIHADLAPGLASLLMQCQVFFTIALAAWLFGERVSRRSLAGLAVALCGLAIIGAHTGADATPTGIVVVLLAAACWAVGNLVVKQAARSAPAGLPMLPFMVWSSLFACAPLVLLALAIEGPATIAASLGAASPAGWAAVIWQALGNALLGFGIWNWLLARHRAEAVTPFALLVPVFGMGSSALLLHEPMPAWKLLAAALVMAGLALHAMPARSRGAGRHGP